MLRIALATALAAAVLFASVWCLFILATGLEGLDGRSSWDGRCLTPDPFAHGLLAGSGAAALVGIWATYLGWLVRRWWWRPGVAATVAAVLLLGLAGVVGRGSDDAQVTPSTAECVTW